jgi:hypothetical protein
MRETGGMYKGSVSQEMAVFITTAVRTSNPLYFYSGVLGSNLGRDTCYPN